jgi:preprotein translocase subunit SecD
MAEYDEAIRQSPGDAELYSFRAALWEEKEDFNRARDDYDKALRIRPDDAELRSKRESASSRAVELVANLTPERIFDITNRVESARVLTSEDGTSFQVFVTLKEEAQQALKEFSEKNIGQKTGLFHKNKLIYVAVLREALSGGNFAISGGRVTQEEAEELAEELNGKP